MNIMKQGLIICSAVSLSFLTLAQEPIKLESHFVGDKEQPAVSYFMSWQGPGSSDKLYRNQEDKYEKSIDTVDRDVMLRSMRIYEEMNLEGRSTR